MTKADARNEQGPVWNWEVDQNPVMQAELTLEGEEGCGSWEVETLTLQVTLPGDCRIHKLSTDC